MPIGIIRPMNTAQIEKQALEASRITFDRLIAAGWRRRDAARQSDMAYTDEKSRLTLAAREDDEA